MKRSIVAQSNASISLSGERLVVSGGTQGIGEGVAYRFAKAGAEVWIVGRNETRAKTVLEKLNEISREQKIEPPPEHYFLRADLSLTTEAKRVASTIRDRAGSQGIDYLVMTQGGPPNGTFVPTSELHDRHYMVQVLSRFTLAHDLASDPASSTVKKAVMSIMAPSRSWVAVDRDDLEMLKAKERGKYGMFAVICRDSCVVDAFTKDLGERNPNVNFTHVFPGAVKTNALNNVGFPWYITLPASLFRPFRGYSPESYAEVPFYLLANPEGRALAGKDRCWDENVSKLEPHPDAKDESFRRKIWDHLLDMMTSKK